MYSTTTSSLLLSSSERLFVTQACHDDLRIDGRTCNEWQHYYIETSNESLASNDNIGNSNINNGDVSQSILPLSSGSARIFNATQTLDLLCSIKADVVKPTSSSSFSQGIVQIYVDTVMSNSNSKSALDHIQTILNDLLAPHLIQNDALVILEDEFVWRLQIDISIVQPVSASSSSCIIDASSQVIRAALQTTKLPLVSTIESNIPTNNNVNNMNMAIDNENYDGNDKTDRDKNVTYELQVNSDYALATPPAGVDKTNIVIVTLTLIADSTTTNNTSALLLVVVDATAIEAACAVLQLHVAVDLSNYSNSNYTIVGLQTSGNGGSLPLSLLPQLTSQAIDTAIDSQKYFTRVPNVANLLLSKQNNLAQTDDDDYLSTSTKFLQPAFQWQ